MKTTLPTPTKRLAALTASCCLAALVATGCSGSLGGEPMDEPTGDVPVGFATTVDTPRETDAPTRAANDDITTANIASMAVFAHYTGQTAWANWPDKYWWGNFMQHQQVVRSGSTWTYSPLKYWPNAAGDKLSFFALAPYDAPGMGGGTTGAAVEYTIPDRYKDQRDLLVATPLLDATKGTPLTFRMNHVLTKVECRIRSSEALTIEATSLYDVYTRGVHNCLTIPFSWDIYKDPHEMEDGADILTSISQNDRVEVPENTLTTLACFYMLPEMAETTYLQLIHLDGGAMVITRIPLPQGDDTVKWKPGGYLIYTVNIDKTVLTVTVTNGGGISWGGDGSNETIEGTKN